MTEVTTETTQQVDIAKKAAIEYVGSHSMTDIIEHLADQYKYLETSKENNRIARNRLQELVDTVTEFITDNLSSGASTSDLKELAEELEIELTKDLTISFTVKYTAEVTVPIDFDADSIDDSDFDVTIRYTGNDDDIDFDDDSTDIEDFEVENN